MAVEMASEERMLLDVVRELARVKVAPRAAEIDASGEFPWDMKELLAKQDILAMPFPEEYGGLGSSELSILMEWLAAYALTEPGSGSDAGSMRTRAERRGDTYVLNGLKHFITNAGIAHVNTVFALTDASAGTRGISAFVVEADRPGFRLGKIENKMGIRGSQTGELVFEECVIPVENLLGNEGDGFKIALVTLDRTRPGIAAQALGIAQGALDFAVGYAKQRSQFGKPIFENQAIQFMLADMDIKIEAARRLIYHVGELMDSGAPRFSRESAIAKTYASDIAMEVTNDAIQVLGGYGYMKEFPVERMMRDAKICQIYEGTNQIQRLVVARALGQASG
jgi:alkylation response protein AidB-like acyl-CoA dehydrogenase